MKHHKLIKSILILLLLLLFCPSVVFAEPGNTVVYRTKTGDCYHQYGCRYLRQSSIKSTLDIVTRLGLRPCSACDPPLLDDETTTPVEKTVRAVATPSSFIKRQERTTNTKVMRTPAPSKQVDNNSKQSNTEELKDFVNNIVYFMSGGAVTFFITYAFKKSNDK